MLACFMLTRVCTPSSPVRERERDRERKERERKREGEREKERERERSRIWLSNLFHCF